MRNGSADTAAESRRLEFTVGQGVTRPRGQRVSVQLQEQGPVGALRDVIARIKPAPEAWLAAGIFQDDHRKESNWEGCDFFAVDVDNQDDDGNHAVVPAEIVTRLEGIFEQRQISGSIAHMTPRGFRIFVILGRRESCSSIALSASLELARLVFTPNSIVKGVERSGRLIVLRDECFSVTELTEVADAVDRSPVEQPLLASASDREPARNGAVAKRLDSPAAKLDVFSLAAEQWKIDNPMRELPRSGGECPACGHDGCFGELPNRPGRWACFSNNHQRDAIRRSLVGATCGREMSDCPGSGFGDALDIEAWQRGCLPRQVLMDDGYMPNPADVFADPSSSSVFERRIVELRAGELRAAITQAEEALLSAAHLSPVYQRGDQLVRVVKSDNPTELRRGVQLPAHTPVLERVQPVFLRALMEEAAEFRRLKADGASTRSGCPADVVAGYQQSAGLWRLPKLRKVIQVPTIRADGSILQEPGYDPSTSLVYDPAGVVFPEVPTTPTRDDARSAIDTMLGPVRHYSFVDSWDQSVWLAALITSFVRWLLPSAPMFVFDAPVRGAGKGKLVNVISTVATGGWPAILTYVDDPNEQRKRIFALLMKGTPIINVDNVDRPLGGATLCTVLTEPALEDRVLGESKTARVPTTATWLATGNNVVVSGDLTRRVLISRIDPAVERPEDLRFPFEPVAYAQQNRPQIVAAVLTLLRAYAAAGYPACDLTPFGSFEEWSDRVRAPLVWAGEEDPVLGREAVDAADSESDRCRLLIESWHELFGDKPMSVAAALRAT